MLKRHFSIDFPICTRLPTDWKTSGLATLHRFDDARQILTGKARKKTATLPEMAGSV